MNLRPSGYEPDELPDCSTPHRKCLNRCPTLAREALRNDVLAEPLQ